MAKRRTDTYLDYIPSEVERRLRNRLKDKNIVLPPAKLEYPGDILIYSNRDLLHSPQRILLKNRRLMKEIYKGKRAVRDGLLVRYERVVRQDGLSISLKIREIESPEEQIAYEQEALLNPSGEDLERIVFYIPNKETKDIDKIWVHLNYPHLHNKAGIKIETLSDTLKAYTDEYFSEAKGKRWFFFNEKRSSWWMKDVEKKYPSPPAAVDDLIKFIFKE